MPWKWQDRLQTDGKILDKNMWYKAVVKNMQEIIELNNKMNSLVES